MRIARGLTQEQLAKKIDQWQSVVSDLERDDYKSPSAGLIAAIAEALATTPQWILNGEGDQTFASRLNRLSTDEHALLNIMRMLDERERSRLLAIAKVLVE